MTGHILRELICMLLVGMSFIGHSLALACPRGVVGFGDSLSDTGNYGILYPSRLPPPPWAYRNPVPNRAANGYAIIDFISMDLGLPPMQPSYGRRLLNGGLYSHGANFAVASSTARDTDILVPYYLSVQVNNYVYWRRTNLLPPELAANALHFIFIGMNDIGQNSGRNATIDQLTSTIVPESVDSIMRGIETLQAHGARNFMVVGVAAMGCLPMLIGNSGTKNHSDYDSFGCFKPLNKLSRLHNTLLQKRLALAQQQHPYSSFIYADLYNLHWNVLKNPETFGFSKDGTQAACCGGVGSAGHPVAQCTRQRVCSSPNSYVSWDGLHFTEAFNRMAAKFLLNGGKYVRPIQDDFNTLCKLHFN